MAKYEFPVRARTIWKIPNATYSPQRAGFQKTPSWWQRVKVRSVGLISVTCLSFIKQTMRHGKPAGRPPTS